MKKKGIIAVALATCVIAGVGAAGCSGDGGNGNKITFYMDIDSSTRPIFEKLVSTYNDGQGKEDGVEVKGMPKAGISTNYNSALTSNSPDVLMAGDGVFRKVVTDLSYGSELLYNMTELYNTMPGDLDLNDMPSGVVNKFRMTQAQGNGYNIAGYGQDIYGVPMTDSACVMYYNEGYFKKMGINIISVEEDKLDGTGTYAKVKPHGYAEYKTEPFAGATQSTNLAGEQVYKVFNNRIPMNWSEYEYVLKMFTPTYNSTQLTANGLSGVKYGGNSEWWYNLGWSVGGDCIGWNGSSYDFTLADDSDNYLVTAENITLNGVEYKAGEVVHYEDRASEDQTKIDGYVTDNSLTVLPSMRDALVEFLKLSVSNNKNVTNSEKGYGICSSERDNRESQFSRGEIAILKSEQTSLRTFKTVLKENVNVAPSEQYRSYGADTYTEGGTDFAHTYLKVIGEEYADGTFTGELEEVNGVKVVGNTQTHSSSIALVMPARASEANRESAWKFIRWVCGPEGQSILKDADKWMVANTEVAYNYAATITDYNAYAFAFATQGGEVYDQSYFKSGEWVTNWANEFNNTLRKGNETLETFLNNKEATAKNDVKKIDIIVKGNR